uniref:Minor capsid protein P11 C-terminal conserved region domain-containing protein n=1 Tax=viral metagenome TaxID=1070528 RepID=A0A6C0K0B2_9ZZZZ
MVSAAFTKSFAIGVAALLVVYLVYQRDPTLGGLLSRYDPFDPMVPATAGAAATAPAAMNTTTNGAVTAAGATGTAKAAAKPAAGTAGTMATTATATPAAGTAMNTNAATALAGLMGTSGQGVVTPAVAGFRNGSGSKSTGSKEGFADLASMEGPAAFASAEAPAGCYPRDQLTPIELLPADQNTIYAQQNPMGVGSLKGKNFLSAGALIGVNTVGQSLRNANLQLRSEPPNPQTPVSIFFQSTIGPDVSHRPLEVGS